MAEVIWSPEAIADTVEIGEYIFADSPQNANMVVEKLIDRAEKLLLQPVSGRAVPEKGYERYREVFEYSYRIIYSTSALPDIIIMRVVHMARLISNI